MFLKGIDWICGCVVRKRNWLSCLVVALPVWKENWLFFIVVSSSRRSAGYVPSVCYKRMSVPSFFLFSSSFTITINTLNQSNKSSLLSISNKLLQSPFLTLPQLYLTPSTKLPLNSQFSSIFNISTSSRCSLFIQSE